MDAQTLLESQRTLVRHAGGCEKHARALENARECNDCLGLLMKAVERAHKLEDVNRGTIVPPPPFGGRIPEFPDGMGPQDRHRPGSGPPEVWA